MQGGHLAQADLRRFAEADRPTAVLATHESFAASLYVDFAEIGLAVGSDVSVVCTFPAVDTRGIVPALSHFHADLDAVGVALAAHLIARLPDSTEAAPGLDAGAAALRAAGEPRAPGDRGLRP